MGLDEEEHTMGPVSNYFAALGTPGSVASADSAMSTGRRSSTQKRQSLSVIQQASSATSLVGSAKKKTRSSKRRKSISTEALEFGPSAIEPAAKEPEEKEDEDEEAVENVDKEQQEEDELPPMAGSPSPQPVKAKNGRRKSSIGPSKSRRDTAESSDLRDLMATLQNSARRSTLESFNTARDSLVSTPGDFGLGTAEKKKKKKEKKNNRRLTADGADLESLLAGLNEEAATDESFHDASEKEVKVRRAGAKLQQKRHRAYPHT